MANILLIFEGASREKKYYNAIKRIFKDEIGSNVNIYPYKTNIHVLYEELNEDKLLNIIDLIQEKARDNEKEYKMLTETKFGEIYLIFDLDPQDDRYGENNIKDMLELFDNETEHGKLYINYPMVESFKHFKSIPDKEFNGYKVTIKQCFSYKSDVAKISCINHTKDIDKDKYSYITKQNLDKINFLIRDIDTCDYNTYINELNQKAIFEMQQKEYKDNENFYIINSLCLWPLDYLGKDMFNEIYSIQINQREVEKT